MARKTTCSKCGRQVEETRHGQRYCRLCHAHYLSIKRKGCEPTVDLEAFQKRECRETTRRRIKSGILVKERCYNCRGVDVEAHHSDYSQPLQVHWLCKSCHNELHQNKSLMRRIHAMPPSDVHPAISTRDAKPKKVDITPEQNKRTLKAIKRFLKAQYG